MDFRQHFEISIGVDKRATTSFYDCMTKRTMWIMIAGPYGFATRTDDQKLENLRKLNAAAFEVFKKGHIPIIGVNMALPIIEVAGKNSYSEIMMPLSLSLCERCDAVWRLEGPSEGADKEVAEFKKRGLPVFYRLGEIP